MAIFLKELFTSFIPYFCMCYPIRDSNTAFYTMHYRRKHLNLPKSLFISIHL